MFERAISGLDIATGEYEVGSSYKSVGTAKSEYRQGNATVQWDIVPRSATYNTTTNTPNPYNATDVDGASKKKRSGGGRRREKRGFPGVGRVGDM